MRTPPPLVHLPHVAYSNHSFHSPPKLIIFDCVLISCAHYLPNSSRTKKTSARCICFLKKIKLDNYGISYSKRWDVRKYSYDPSGVFLAQFPILYCETEPTVSNSKLRILADKKFREFIHNKIGHVLYGQRWLVCDCGTASSSRFWTANWGMRSLVCAHCGWGKVRGCPEPSPVVPKTLMFSPLVYVPQFSYVMTSVYGFECMMFIIL